MENTYGLLIDYGYCTGCQSCEVACKEEHGYPVGKWGIRVHDDGPWEIEEHMVNWNKLPFPPTCATCALRARLSDANRPACTIAWQTSSTTAPLPSSRRNWQKSRSRCFLFPSTNPSRRKGRSSQRTSLPEGFIMLPLLR